MAQPPTPPAAPVTSTSPLPGLRPELLERHRGEHRGDAGAADGHRLLGPEGRGKRDQRHSGRTRARLANQLPQWVMSVRMPVRTTASPWRHSGLVDFEHRAGEVHAGHMRIRANARPMPLMTKPSL